MNQKITTGATLGAANTPESNQYNDDHERMLHTQQDNFVNILSASGNLLYRTDVEENLFETYLDNLPHQEMRQHHNCSACRHFVNHFGGLVAIDDDGKLHSALWDLPGMDGNFYEPAITALARKAKKAKVTGVFLTDQNTLGQPHTGQWTHLAVRVPRISKYKATLTPNQAAAEKKEDFKNLMVALSEFNRATLEAVVQLFKSDALYRTEKFLAPVEFLVRLMDIRDNTKDRVLKHNLLWREIGAAPAGFCHPKSGVIGTLLTDLQNGVPFLNAKANFKTLTNPDVYMRPTAAPKAQQVARAEQIVADLGVATALERRFMRFEEVKLMWEPPVAKDEPAKGGVFGHLKPRGSRTDDEPLAISAGTQTISWTKFQQTVLPNAESIRYLVPGGRSSYVALLTSVHEDAKPILQWDSEDQRNPASWYTYREGSHAVTWNLQAGKRTKVVGITQRPHQWYSDKFAHQGNAVIFLLEGCRDTNYRGVGNGLFPELLKSEFHEIRSTIEAYSLGTVAEGYEEATANGVTLQQGGATVEHSFEVVVKGISIVYKIDRWD